MKMFVTVEQNSITVVRDESGDWEGVYMNGQLLEEGHSIDGCQMLDALGISYGFRESSLGDAGSLPNKLEDVKLA